MNPLDTLPQNEGVLYANGNDEGRPQEKTLKENACHLSGLSLCEFGRRDNRRCVIRFSPCTIRFLLCAIRSQPCVICSQLCVIRFQPCVIRYQLFRYERPLNTILF